MARHVRKIGASCCVVGGDFNETPDGFLDRAVRSPEGYDRGTSNGSYTIRHMAQHGTDVYRYAHPLTHENVAMSASSESQGHSYFQPGCGSSRIDLSLFFPPLQSATGVRAFVDDERLSDGLDHRPICFMVPLFGGKAASRRATPPWKAKTLFVNGISAERADALEMGINASVDVVLQRWNGPLNAICLGDGNATEVLQNALEDFVSAFFTAAHKVVGGRHHSGPGVYCVPVFSGD